MFHLLKRFWLVAFLALLISPARAADNAPTLIVIGNVPVNMKTTGATNIVTTDGVKTFYVTGISMESTAAFAIVTAATVSFGTNSPSCNNISSGISLGTLVSAAMHNFMSISSPVSILSPGTTVCANVTIAAIGTSQTVNFGVAGFYK